MLKLFVHDAASHHQISIGMLLHREEVRDFHDCIQTMAGYSPKPE